MKSYATIVVGLGAVGSATAFQLAKRGMKVLGIDRYAPPHSLGSSHGETRITRVAIGEGVQYTPLAKRSHELWREIERETGFDLLTVTGGLIISSAARTGIMHVENFFENTAAAARTHGIAHELLDAAGIRKRFPQFAIGDGEFGYFEPGAGFLRPEECVRAQLSLALKYGGEIHANEKLIELESGADSVVLVTDRDRYIADRVILALGSWLPEFMSERYAQLFKVSRQVLYWFDAKDIASFLPERFPVFIWEIQATRQGIYGIPAIDGEGGGVKIATEQHASVTTPEEVKREVTQQEIREMYECSVAPYLPGLNGHCIKSATCLYTMTPDFGFVLDIHPDFERVIVASPCSGHGFKHSAAIGEALAEQIVEGGSALDANFPDYRFGRFLNAL